MSRSISKHMQHMNPSLIRELFKAAQREDMISFTAGSPSPEEFPLAELVEVSKTVFAEKAVQALSYEMCIRDRLKTMLPNRLGT